MKLKITTSQKILELRRKLQQVSDISFAFSKLNRDYPFDQISSEEQARELITAYDGLITNTVNALDQK